MIIAIIRNGHPLVFLIIMCKCQSIIKTNDCQYLHINKCNFQSVLIDSNNWHHHRDHQYHDHHNHHDNHHHHDDHYDVEVRVTKRADGREENMRDLGRGDYFGEQVMIDDKIRWQLMIYLFDRTRDAKGSRYGRYIILSCWLSYWVFNQEYLNFHHLAIFGHFLAIFGQN